MIFRKTGVHFPDHALDISLLRGLLVAWIHDAVDHDGDEQNHTLDHVLAGVLDVHDSHAVEQRADQERADDDVADAALAAGKTDAAENDNEDDVVEKRRIDNAG